MGIAGNEWGFQVGTLPKGARDKISDVPGDAAFQPARCADQGNGQAVRGIRSAMCRG